MSIRLAKLPNRTPVRLSISIDPELSDALSDYASIYEQTHGQAEKPETLIPAILEAFLASDSGFKRARRALHTNARNGD